MRAAVVLVSVCLLPASASAQAEWMKSTVQLGAIVGAGIDLATTEHCLGAQTCQEGNKALSWVAVKGPVAFGAWKMGITGIVLYFIDWLWEQGGRSRWWSVGLGVAAAATWTTVWRAESSGSATG